MVERRQFLVGTLGACMGVSSLATPVVDPAGRPATQSARAAYSLLTGVAQAGNRVVAVGDRGIILLSDDNAATWRQAITPVSSMLTAVQFASAKVGWAVGHSGVVLKTEDGGGTWTRQLDGVQVAQLALAEAEHLADERDEETVARAVATAKRLVQDGADKPFLDLHVANDNECFVVGAFGLAVRTRDGGKTWASVMAKLPNPTGSHLYGIAAAEKTLYIAGEMGLVLRSDDVGEHFAKVAMPYGGSYFGVLATTPKQVLVYGLNGNAYASSDAGEHWDKVETAIAASLSSALRLSDGRIVLAGFNGQLSISSNGAMSFSALRAGSPIPTVSVGQAKDGSLIVVGVRGPRRITAQAFNQTPKA